MLSEMRSMLSKMRWNQRFPLEPVQNQLLNPECEEDRAAELSRRRSDGCTVRTSLRRRDFHGWQNRIRRRPIHEFICGQVLRPAPGHSIRQCGSNTALIPRLERGKK